MVLGPSGRGPLILSSAPNLLGSLKDSHADTQLKTGVAPAAGQKVVVGVHFDTYACQCGFPPNVWLVRGVVKEVLPEPTNVRPATQAETPATAVRGSLQLKAMLTHPGMDLAAAHAKLRAHFGMLHGQEVVCETQEIYPAEAGFIDEVTKQPVAVDDMVPIRFTLRADDWADDMWIVVPGSCRGVFPA